MRKLLLPAALLAAVVVVVVVVVKFSGNGQPKSRDEVAKEPEPAIPESPVRPSPLKPRSTPTSLSQNKWLSELERALGRDDLSRVLFFRQKLCEEIDVIRESELLSRNLIEDIRKHGVESDDPKRRDAVLPILRVFGGPDATALVEAAYYGALNEDERMTLLEAMAQPIHNPEKASTWAVELALNAETEEARDRAFRTIYDYSKDWDLIFRTALAIREGTTRPKQARNMLSEIAGVGGNSTEARDYLLRKLKNPRSDEIGIVASSLPSWGEAKHVPTLEQLAREFPAHREMLLEMAEQLRIRLGEEARREGQPVPPEDVERAPPADPEEPHEDG